MKLIDGFTVKKIGDDTVAIYVGGDTVDMTVGIELNPVARLLFTALLAETTKEELIKLLLENYDITPEMAKEDVRVFINDLTNKGLLTEDEKR